MCKIINICVPVKNPKHWQPYQFFGNTKTLHTLIEMGSAADENTTHTDRNG